MVIKNTTLAWECEIAKKSIILSKNRQVLSANTSRSSIFHNQFINYLIIYSYDLMNSKASSIPITTVRTSQLPTPVKSSMGSLPFGRTIHINSKSNEIDRSKAPKEESSGMNDCALTWNKDRPNHPANVLGFSSLLRERSASDNWKWQWKTTGLLFFFL